MYCNKCIIFAFEYSEASDMSKRVMQRMTHNSFSSREIILYAHTNTTEWIFLYLCDYLFQLCVWVCVCADTHWGL